MPDIGIGIVGGGYMGKAHAMAMGSVARTFDLALRPTLVSVAASSPASAERYRDAFGFAKAAADWREVVEDPSVDAIIIASPQNTHKDIALAAAAKGKPVFCEKPLGASVEEANAMVDAVENAGVANMVGFNYPRAPAVQLARKLLADGRIGRPYFFRIEHSEDFYADPNAPASWRTRGMAYGTAGDLAPHPVNAAMALGGAIAEVSATIDTVVKERPGDKGMEPVLNDDVMQFMCRFESGATGHILASRVATGRKMGYVFEVFGEDGALRFDMEDQNSLWFFDRNDPSEIAGFRRILTGHASPDFAALCPGDGHGTGYQEQIVIEAKDFLKAIETGNPVWPTFRDGLDVWRVINAGLEAAKSGGWEKVG